MRMSAIPRSAVENLVRLCKRLGKDPLLVQAGGGNISVKASDNLALIKASGLRLKDVTLARGWAAADLAALRRELPRLAKLRSASRRDAAYVELLARAGKSPPWRISLEAGFHALMPEPYVAHVHSVAGLILSTIPAGEARERIRRALGPGVSVRTVPPSVPGAELTVEFDRILRNGGGGSASLWLLKNHGVVWGAASVSRLLALSRRFEKRFGAAFKLPRYPMPHEAGSRECRMEGREEPGRRTLCFCRWPSCRFHPRALFPDLVVYFHHANGWGPELKKVSSRRVSILAKNDEDFRNKTEVFFAHALVSTLSRPGGLRALPPAVAKAIAGLTTEKIRLKQAARK